MNVVIQGGRSWEYTRDFSFDTNLLRDDLPEQLQSALKRWVEMFSGFSFAKNVSGKYTEAWAVSHDSAIENQDLLEECLREVIGELAEMR